MSSYPTDRLVFTPRDVDLARSPLAGAFDVATYCLGAFNPALTMLPNGNLLAMVRIAEALRVPSDGEKIHAINWGSDGYRLDGWPLDAIDAQDPRKFMVLAQQWPTLALTSLSWLLPVELSPDGLEIVAVHYDRAIAPANDQQCYGVEDARISRIGDRYFMTTCSVSAERHSTTLYRSDNGLDWRYEGIVLDHQNKDMLIFEGLVGGRYWAQTRPLGQLFFAYPPHSPWLSGPSINLATSPDALHWKPHEAPHLRPRIDTPASARMGGGTPPILTADGWLSLWHGVEPSGPVGIYRTYWALMDRDDPSLLIHRSDPVPLIEPAPHLTAPLADLMYLDNVVFTTGIVDAGDHYIVASGEADLACRITHLPKTAFEL